MDAATFENFKIRLETASLKFLPNSNYLCRGTVKLGYVGFGYKPATHSFEMCPSSENLTRPTLIRILSHEISHLLSPCHSSDNLYKAQFQNDEKELLEKIGSCSKIPDSSKETAHKLFKSVSYIAEDTNGISIQDLSACGLLKPVAAGMSASANPFLQEQTCLSALYKTNISERHKAALAYIDDSIKKSDDENIKKTALETRKKIESETSEEQACNYSKLEEHRAEISGAKLAGYFLSSHKDAFQKDFPLKFMFFDLTEVCAEKRSISHSDPDRYPVSKTRMDAYLQNEDVQRALGCRYEGSSTCLPERVNSTEQSGKSQGIK